MFYQDLFKLYTDIDSKFYNINLIADIDNYLGKFEKGTILKSDDIEFAINNPLKISKLLKDLEKLGILRINEDEYNDEDIDINYYEILIKPEKTMDKEYEKYLKSKRAMNCFEIIYNRVQNSNNGFFLLLDIKGYSKNINSENKQTRLLMHYFMTEFNEKMNKLMERLFYSDYSGIIIKQNGDGWLLYFEKINDAINFSRKLTNTINEKSYETMQILGLNIKMYLHYIEKIEKMYRTDTLHFDVEGEEVIYLFLIEKKIEEEIYRKRHCNFLAYTKEAYNYLSDNQKIKLTQLNEINFNISDSEGNSKIKKKSDIYFEVLT